MPEKAASDKTDLTSDLSLGQSKSQVPMSSFKDIAIELVEKESYQESVTLKSVKLSNKDVRKRTTTAEQNTHFNKEVFTPTRHPVLF